MNKTKWIISGSTALYHWYPDARKPGDLDVLTPAKVHCSTPSTFLVDTSWHDAAEALIDASKDKVFLDPDLLLTLKVSHAAWDIKWAKTMFDINFLYDKGHVVNEEIHAKLYAAWKQVHGKKKVNLKQSTKTFWNDAVKRRYDHEEVHRHVMFYDRPMHEIIRPNPESVWCSVETFNALSANDQICLVLEEIMATAIERADLDLQSSKIDIIKAVNHAYFKLVTSMSTGWFSRFLIRYHRAIISTWRPVWESQIRKALTTLATISSPSCSTT